MAKESTLTPSDDQGSLVAQFATDLTNYSQIRRGLSPAMRAQTMTKTELRSVSEDVVKKYIEALNVWRNRPLGEKIRRSRKEKTALEDIFQKVMNNDEYTTEQKAMIKAANIKVKSMSQENARMQIREALNNLDRAKIGGWYNPEDYWKNKYYLDNETWDPAKASDSMLRIALTYKMMVEDSPEEEATKDEYLERLGGGNEEYGRQAYASVVSGYNQDIIDTATWFVAGK